MDFFGARFVGKMGQAEDHGSARCTIMQPRALLQHSRLRNETEIPQVLNVMLKRQLPECEEWAGVLQAQFFGPKFLRDTL